MSCKHAKEDTEVRGVALPLTSSIFPGSLRLPLKIRGYALGLSHEQQIENQKLPRRGRLSAKLMTQLRKGFGQRINGSRDGTSIGETRIFVYVYIIGYSDMKSYPIWNEYQCTQSQRMTQKLAWFERRQVKKGAKQKKKWKRRRQRKREESSLQSPSLFLEFFTPRCSLLSEGLEQANSRHLATPLLVSCEMISDKRVQKFHFDDATVRPRSG